MSLNIGPEYYVDRNTSYVLVDTSFPANSTAVVYLSSISIPGRIVSVKDSTGGLDVTKFITVSTSKDVYFANSTVSASFNAPYGFITCTNQGPRNWVITNTYGFPTQSTPAYTLSLTAGAIQVSSISSFSVYTKTLFVSSIITDGLTANSVTFPGYVNITTANEFTASTITSSNSIRGLTVETSNLTASNTILTSNITASNSILTTLLTGSNSILGSNLTASNSVSTSNLTSYDHTASNSVTTNILNTRNILHADTGNDIILCGNLDSTSNIRASNVTGSNSVTTNILYTSNVLHPTNANSYIVCGNLEGSNVRGSVTLGTDTLRSFTDNVQFYSFDSLKPGFLIKNTYEIQGLFGDIFLRQASSGQTAGRFGLSNVSGIAFNNGGGNYKIYGTATLVSGTCSISSDFNNVNAIVLVQRTTPNSSLEVGHLSVDISTPIGGFTVTSYRVNGNLATDDNSSFTWILFNPTFP